MYATNFSEHKEVRIVTRKTLMQSVLGYGDKRSTPCRTPIYKYCNHHCLAFATCPMKYRIRHILFPAVFVYTLRDPQKILLFAARTAPINSRN